MSLPICLTCKCWFYHVRLAPFVDTYVCSNSFDGEVVDPEELYSGKPPLMDFIGRNSKQLRRPEILAAAQELKLKYNKVGAIGYCYGGWAVFQLGEKGNNLVDCISTAHPSFVDKREIECWACQYRSWRPKRTRS